MNKKIVTLILVVLISFCFLSIVVADHAAHNDKNTSDHSKAVDKTKVVNKNKTIDKNKTTNKSKTLDSNKNYIIAMGSGSDILFSDGYRGFMVDHSKPAAHAGDKFKRASTSTVSNSNSLKHGIIKSYRQDSSDNIGNEMSNALKNNTNNTTAVKPTPVQQKGIGDHEVVKINNHTEATFNFEVLKSASGNTSDYFAYEVSMRTIEETNQTNNVTNETNTTNATNKTNTANLTKTNKTNTTFLKGLYDYLAFLANALYGAWKPIVDTLINNALLIVNALEGLADMFANFMAEMQSLMNALGELIKMFESLWKELDGLMKLFAIILNAIQQLLDLIQSIIDFIMELISAIIALIQELIDLLLSLLQFLIDLIYQLIALIQAIIDFLKSLGSFLINVIENAVILVAAFLIITIGAFIYNRIR